MDPLSRLVPADNPTPLPAFRPRHHQVIGLLTEGLLVNNPSERGDMGTLLDLVSFLIRQTEENGHVQSPGRGGQVGSVVI